MKKVLRWKFIDMVSIIKKQREIDKQLKQYPKPTDGKK